MIASTQQTAQALGALSVNERAWFWLCADAEPALLILPASDPAGVGALRKAASAVPRSGSAPQFAGVAAITGSGQLRLCGQRLSRAGLEGLATWVGRNIAAHPGLARARKAALICTDAKGAVAQTHEDDSLWPEPPPAREPLPPTPGSTEECGAYLSLIHI